MVIFKTVLLACVFFSCVISYSQTVSIDTDITAQELIETHLFEGCIEISNVHTVIDGSVIGLSSFGTFSKSNSNFPFSKGIVLSSGNANSAGNTIITENLNEGNTNWGTDSDLFDELGITNSLNATSIEFDFISALDKVRFEYIFTSEEYLQFEYVCDKNDVFALLIREASSTGPYINIATVGPQNNLISPGTIHPDIFGFCDAENESFFDNYSIGDTNFDGRTTPISSTANVTPNVLYRAKLIVADSKDENFDSAVFLKTNTIEPKLDLGDDFSTCASSVTLNANIAISSVRYDWYLNGELVLADGPSTFTVNQTGSYTVKATTPLNLTECVFEDTINVTLSSVQTINPISDYVLCDLNGNQVKTFDLFTKNSDVLAAAPSETYTISYHFTLEDAEAHTRPITTTIENSSNPQIVYVRLEDSTGCLAYAPINLIVSPIPTLPNLDPFIVCDSDALRDQTTVLNLSSFDTTITAGDVNLGVSYHTTFMDATSGNDPLPSRYTSSSVQLYTRIFNRSTGCFNVTPIDIQVYNTPILNSEPVFLDACDPEHDGFASFNLETALPQIIADLTGLTASFYTTLTNAQRKIDPIPIPTDYTNTVIQEQEIYLRIEDDISGCYSVRSFEIHTNLLLSETNLEEISFCDDNIDGMHTFSFDSVSDRISNMLEGLTITYYETQDDQINNTPITTPSYSFTGPSLTLFIDIENITCLEQAEIVFSLTDVVQFANIPDQIICDTDTDGFTNLNLNNFNSDVTGGISGFQVFYYETLSNAENNIGAIPYNYRNITNPQTLYVSVTENSTTCSDVSSFEITVVPTPDINIPLPIIICDDDADGFSLINLDSLIPLLTSMSNSVDFSFFESLDNANQDNNPITTTNAFNAETQTLFIRAEENLTSLRCPIIIPLDVIVNTLPIIPQIDNYDICVDSSSNPSFLFITKDSEILNGQSDKEVFYYEDANFMQLINKNQPYIGSSFPQTIYVKVDNITDSNCFSTSSFEINTFPFPVYNSTINIDITQCETDEVDGKIDIDLNPIITTLTQGISPAPTISFFSSYINADNNTNPLPLNYKNTSNPQTLYIRIEHDNGCYLIDDFGINVLATPLVEQINNITQCDTDYDGLTIFNLNDFEIDIFDVRKDFLVSSYFLNLEALENGFPEINSTDAFQTTSNPQTIYIKVLNTASQCFSSAPLTLTSILPPTINQISEHIICDPNTPTFDLSQLNTLFSSETQDLTFQYFEALSNAENKFDPISEYNFQIGTSPLFVRLQSNITNCYYIHKFNLIINPNPNATQLPNLESCDNDFDGILEFDLSSQTALILGDQISTNFSVSFHKDMEDAEQNNAPLNEIHTVTNFETVFARIINTVTECVNYTQFTITVNPLPIINIPQQVICLDNLPLIVSAETNNFGDTYIWSTGQTTNEIIIDTIGIYSVTVTTPNGCTNSANFEVIVSEAATIKFTEVLNFTDPNSITITADGIGDYRYKLDNGPLQVSNFFNFVKLGYHTITVVDLNGCNETTKEVLVINAQKFFTPNNDTYFDTWNIIGIETLPESTIIIFDRFGKILKKLNHNSGGWDGTYNGQLMPATDYWFLAKIKTPTKQFDYKGHFALKR